MRRKRARAILLFDVLRRTLFSEVTDQVGETVEDGDGAEPFAIVDGRVTADGCAGRDVTGDSGLRGGDGSVADGAMAGDSNLAGEDDVLADVGGAGETYLSAEEGVFSHSR